MGRANPQNARSWVLTGSGGGGGSSKGWQWRIVRELVERFFQRRRLPGGSRPLSHSADVKFPRSESSPQTMLVQLRARLAQANLLLAMVGHPLALVGPA